MAAPPRGGGATGHAAGNRQAEMKQYSEACDQNRMPILEVLQQEFAQTRHVLEIGSGTGQHAVFFGCHLSHLLWQTSDLEQNHASIHAWLAESGLQNVAPPLLLDVTRRDWHRAGYDGIFSANTTHIMHWPAVVSMFGGIGKVLEQAGCFCLYGPFKYGDRHTSDSNLQFDLWLKGRDPASGLRNFEDLDELARNNGLALRADHEMPVNNRLLVWEKY